MTMEKRKSFQTQFGVKVRTTGQFISNVSAAEKVTWQQSSDMSLAGIKQLYETVTGRFDDK